MQDPSLGTKNADVDVKTEGWCTLALAPAKTVPRALGAHGGPLATHGCPSYKKQFDLNKNSGAVQGA